MGTRRGTEPGRGAEPERGAWRAAPGAPGDDALRSAVVRALARAGGAVVIAGGAGNLVRPARPGETPGLPFVVEVEGLPNLLHEFVHFALRPPLAVDHGFDYALIPFDTAQLEPRRWLWEELACCVVSCAYLAARPARVAPWFAEQVGIQHHFYGFDGPERFLPHVAALVAAHGAELEAAIDEAYAAAATHLADAGAENPGPPQRLAFAPLFAALSAARCATTSPGSARG